MPKVLGYGFIRFIEPTEECVTTYISSLVDAFKAYDPSLNFSTQGILSDTSPPKLLPSAWEIGKRTPCMGFETSIPKVQEWLVSLCLTKIPHFSGAQIVDLNLTNQPARFQKDLLKRNLADVIDYGSDEGALL